VACSIIKSHIIDINHERVYYEIVSEIGHEEWKEISSTFDQWRKVPFSEDGFIKRISVTHDGLVEWLSKQPTIFDVEARNGVRDIVATILKLLSGKYPVSVDFF
jgi:hypothetical protein